MSRASEICLHRYWYSIKLREHGIIADLMPEKYTAASLGELLAEKCDGEKILILRALGGSPELNEKLEEKV